MLSKERIDEFKQIFFEELGESLSDQEAAEKAHTLLNLFKVVYRPIPLDDHEK